MDLSKGKEKASFRITTKTWYKDSHSLFDYESTKITEMIFEFPLTTKGITFYRKKNASNIVACDVQKNFPHDPEEYEFLTHAEVQIAKTNNRIRVNLFNSSSYKDKNKKLVNEKQKTNSSIEDINEIEEQPYLIISKLTNANDMPAGHKLLPGMTLKLGRIEFYISQFSDGNKKIISPKDQKNKSYFNDSIVKYLPIAEAEKHACKICLDETESQENFLFHPCKCKGSSGTVHIECLLQWIQVKVKKEVIGGTLHYNFQKFECQVCKAEFPGYIDVNGSLKELLSLERPIGNYIILEGACQKEKSIMIIQNTPLEGIKLGRGHECQIRITDISVSRKHALIKSNNQEFFIFDNKSKFGTLVREESMNFELKKQKRSLQIGRSTLDFELHREKL